MDRKPIDLICDITAISGELSLEQAGRLCNSYDYTLKLVTQLKNNNRIKVYYKDSLRGYRLTTKEKAELLRVNPARFAFFITGNAETHKIRSEISRRHRLHRVSEVYITMYKAGVIIFRDEKPDIFYAGESAPINNQGQMLNTPVFYSSIEVKNMGDEAIKMNNSRMAGVILTKDTPYIIYNTHNTIMKWSHKSELRAKATITLSICHNRLNAIYGIKEVRGIITGDSMEIAYKLLSGTNTPKGNYILDAGFENFYFVPNNTDGELMIRLITDERVKNELNLTLSDDLLPPGPEYNIDSDAMDSDGKPVLFAYDLDLPRLSRFLNTLRLYDIRGVIICFDFQAETIEKFCGKYVDIQTIKKDKFERRFLM